jgi:hypothetical protein
MEFHQADLVMIPNNEDVVSGRSEECWSTKVRIKFGDPVNDG